MLYTRIIGGGGGVADPAPLIESRYILNNPSSVVLLHDALTPRPALICIPSEFTTRSVRLMLCVLCVETRDSPDHLPLGRNVKPAASTPDNFNWNDRGGGGGEGKFDFVSEFDDRESLEA